MWKVRSVQLRARLADRLRGQDADCLTHVDQLHGGEVAAVAHAADTAARLAGEHRADVHLLDAGLFDVIGGLFIHQLARGHQQPRVAVLVELMRIEDILGRATMPMMRSFSDSMTSSPSLRADISRPFTVPQSSSVIVTSCATSTRRRVR